MTPEALPHGLQFLILMNAFIDIPLQMLRRGGIVLIFGLCLLPIMIAVVAIPYILTSIYRLIAYFISLFQSSQQEQMTSSVMIQDPSTVSLSTSNPSLSKFIGEITWTYLSDKPDDKYPVRRAILDGSKMTIDCNTGSKMKPYIFTIILHTENGKYFKGTFVGGSSPNDTDGTAEGTLQHALNGVILSGTWIEQGEESKWLMALKQVDKFPDEVEA